MKNNMKRTATKGVLRLLDVLIVFFGIVLAIAIIAAVFMFKEADSYNYSNTSINYAMKGGEYSRMVSYAISNRASGYGIGDRDYEEYYAVADYFEAQVYAHMYDVAGDSARAAKWSAKAEEAVPRMGLLSPEAEKINECVGIR